MRPESFGTIGKRKQWRKEKALKLSQTGVQLCHLGKQFLENLLKFPLFLQGPYLNLLSTCTRTEWQKCSELKRLKLCNVLCNAQSGHLFLLNGFFSLGLVI